MPIQPTYPGVYLQEESSGVKTITGVSTSVCAFVGTAKRGPINKAVNILNYSDFERRFGGLSADSEMSYAVRQFFANGGTNAWVVRLAKSSNPSSKTFTNGTVNVLTISALDEGASGNNIEVRVDYNTSNPASSFNLTLNYNSPDNPQDSDSESYLDLSMNSHDPRYVENIINGISKLVKVERVTAAFTGMTDKGTSTSGSLTGVSPLTDGTHNRIRIVMNGSDPIEILLTKTILAEICDEIKNQVIANPLYAAFTCTAGANTIIMTSAIGGEESSIRVLPGLINDAAARLKLGTLFGGIELDAVASKRPSETPDHGELKGENITTLPTSATGIKIKIRIDGYGPDTIDFSASYPSTIDLFASVIQSKVRELKPGNSSYSKFTCSNAGGSLVLASGSRGLGSSVNVYADGSDGLANGLKLITSGAVSTDGSNVFLEGGLETAFTSAEAYNVYIGNRLLRKGIYALESVDLFNLLCLPGVSESGILMDADAYCKERRAFMIADPPQTLSAPSDMITAISGTAFPKTEYGAVYYPWIKISDPLNSGKLRSCPPSGTIAGLYARTDSNRGVWKAPAGTEATLTGVRGVDYVLTDPENGTLNPLGVNCIRVFPVFGTIAWGARTLRGADQMTSEYKYIPVRRLALYIEESLYRGLKWVVFEPNDEPLWSQIRLNVGAFMHNLFRQGAFQGMTPKDAYFVKCDKETTTQNDINLGIVNIWVGFAPLKPAEFVILHIQQMAGQINQ
jgi:uncharacterized protein